MPGLQSSYIEFAIMSLHTLWVPSQRSKTEWNGIETNHTLFHHSNGNYSPDLWDTGVTCQHTPSTRPQSCDEVSMPEEWSQSWTMQAPLTASAYGNMASVEPSLMALPVIPGSWGMHTWLGVCGGVQPHDWCGKEGKGCGYVSSHSIRVFSCWFPYHSPY